MRLLLDTHAFLWFAAGDRSLSAKARRRIESVRNDKLVSLASVWEIAIKASLGKLRLSIPLSDLIQQGCLENGIMLLDVRLEHALGVGALPWHHGDPFDRMLVVQAKSEDLKLVSRDDVFDTYGVNRIW